MMDKNYYLYIQEDLFKIMKGGRQEYTRILTHGDYTLLCSKINKRNI